MPGQFIENVHGLSFKYLDLLGFRAIKRRGVRPGRTAFAGRHGGASDPARFRQLQQGLGVECLVGGEDMAAEEIQQLAVQPAGDAARLGDQ